MLTRQETLIHQQMQRNERGNRDGMRGGLGVRTDSIIFENGTLTIGSLSTCLCPFI